MADQIRFYKLQDEFGCFSNFAPYPIELQGQTWPTVEHFFQAQKFLAEEHQEAIRQVTSPMIAARMGRSRQRPLRADWEEVKDSIMTAAVRAKFSQHLELKQILLDTGEAELIEHSRNDSYWADGGDGQGLNRLGQILMQIRSELRG